MDKLLIFYIFFLIDISNSKDYNIYMKAIIILTIFFQISFNKALAQSKSLYNKQYVKFQRILKKKIEAPKLINKKQFKKVKVAVIDTGVDLNNPFLNQEGRYPASIDDKNGHGSHVAGIISLLTQNNKMIEIIPYNYYNQDHSGKDNLESLLVQLKKAIKDNVDIINISGGGPEPSKREKELIELARKKGIIIVTASGNESTDLDNIIKCYFMCNSPFAVNQYKYYPASYGLSNIISVSNYVNRKRVENSSNIGKETVTLGTYGTNIPSFNKKFSTRPKYMTGTSMATPIITSAIAQLKQRYPFLKLYQIKHILKVNSIKDKNTQYGFFSYYSFINWMNKDYSYFDLNPNNTLVDLMNTGYFNEFIIEIDKTNPKVMKKPFMKGLL